MVGVKRKYIEAAYRLLERDGLEGVSIRKVADEIGCSSAALYRHFPDVNRLTAVASARFLRPYLDNARILSQVDLSSVCPPCVCRFHRVQCCRTGGSIVT